MPPSYVINFLCDLKSIYLKDDRTFKQLLSMVYFVISWRKWNPHIKKYNCQTSWNKVTFTSMYWIMFITSKTTILDTLILNFTAWGLGSLVMLLSLACFYIFSPSPQPISVNLAIFSLFSDWSLYFKLVIGILTSEPQIIWFLLSCAVYKTKILLFGGYKIDSLTP